MIFNLIIGFDWDAGSAKKNDVHGVSQSETKQVFANTPLLTLDDTPHSPLEPRFHALGQTDTERRLHIMFTLRSSNTLIRLISARDMHRKERARHEQQTQANS